MKTLKTEFKMNGLPYTLIKRNDKVALYGIGGTYTDEIPHWEVTRIEIRKDKYGIRESMPCNEKFGKEYSRCFMNKVMAYKYFDKLTNLLDPSQWVSEVMPGVEANSEAA